MRDRRDDSTSADRTLALSAAFRITAWIVAILGIIAGLATGLELHSQTCDIHGNCAPAVPGNDIAVVIASIIGGALFWAALLAALAAILDMQARSFMELCNITDLLAASQGYDVLPNEGTQSVEERFTFVARSTQHFVGDNQQAYFVGQRGSETAIAYFPRTPDGLANAKAKMTELDNI